MTMRRNRRAGSTLVEFTLVGIPLMFILISIFEISRGMWVYQTLAYATKEATRFVVVKGANCVQNGNTCGVTVQTVARIIEDRGVGLVPAELNVTLASLTDTRTCNPLSSCFNNATPWPTLTTPPDTGSNTGQNIRVTATYPFRSAISLFWPGTAGQQFGVFTLGSTSVEGVQF